MLLSAGLNPTTFVSNTAGVLLLKLAVCPALPGKGINPTVYLLLNL